MKLKRLKPAEDIWNLEELLAGKTYDEHVKSIKSDVDKYKENKNILSKDISPEKILEIIKFEEKISTDFSRVSTYYSLKYSENNKDPNTLAKISEMDQLESSVNNDTLFFELWFTKLDSKNAIRLIESKELTDYKYFLTIMREGKKYLKSEKIEKILSIKNITGSDSFSKLYEIITDNYKFDFKDKKVDSTKLISKFRDTNPEVREKVYDILLSKYREDSTVLSEIYKNIVLDWHNEGIKVRGHENAINVFNASEDISDKSVEILLNTIKKNNHLFQEYFKIKYEINKKAGNNYPYSRYHLYAPLKIEKTKKYGYEESKEIILDTFKKFDERFYLNAKKIFDEKHVHAKSLPSKNKAAFSMTTPGHTPYILLNHTDDLKSLTTMIHEFGHGVHGVFSGKQSYHLQDTSTAICETASIFSEMILADRMLKETTNDNEKMAMLTNILDDQFASISRQAYIVMFEKYAHENIPKGATKDDLDNEYGRLLKEQFGNMKIPTVFKSEWNYIPHIHGMPFYCYGYAWGNLSVLSFYDMYKKEGKPFIDKYVDLLSSGGNGSTADLMKKLGVNPESEKFWQRGFDVIKEEIEELKKLI